MENHTTPNQVDSLFELTEACPSEMELAAYIEGTLSFPERYLLERHLMTCFRCSEIAASYQRERNQEMKEAIPEPRPDISPYAPRISNLFINPDKVADVIGPAGKIIKKLSPKPKPK